MTEILLELDDRKRASLARIAQHSRYLVEIEPDGTLIMKPAVVMSEEEAAFLTNTALVAKIEEQRAHPERRVPRKRPEK
ncbi:MAG: hypothetical protein QG608_1891 [Actinomycetota bacterium]|nr:hypothetical protein [Actinomycetota bacterium]